MISFIYTAHPSPTDLILHFFFQHIQNFIPCCSLAHICTTLRWLFKQFLLRLCNFRLQLKKENFLLAFLFTERRRRISSNWELWQLFCPFYIFFLIFNWICYFSFFKKHSMEKKKIMSVLFSHQLKLERSFGIISLKSSPYVSNKDSHYPHIL